MVWTFNNKERGQQLRDQIENFAMTMSIETVILDDDNKGDDKDDKQIDN